MDRPVLTTASFCTGVGLLDEGVRCALDWLGCDVRPALLCEWEAYAAATLLARMEDAALEPCPVWCGDLGDLDCQPFRGLVDLVTAGLPCQPYSTAGKKRGLSDERSYGDGSGPLPQFLRCLDELGRPSLVVLENVPPWITRGWFRPFGEELSGMGYEIETPLFVTAKSVGASHRRERAFVLAHRAGGRLRELREASRRHRLADGCGAGLGNTELQRGERRGIAGELPGAAKDAQAQARQRQRVRRGDCDSGAGLGHAEHGAARDGEPREAESEESDERRRMLGPADRSGVHGRVVHAGSDGGRIGKPRRPAEGRKAAGGRSGTVVHAERAGPQGAGHAGEARNAITADAGDGERLFAPGRNRDVWRGITADAPQLAPAIEPGLRLLADGRAVVVDESRADQLRCAGNGCVPLAAAVAFIELVWQAE